jgi:outer membrane protein assembly factor BamA
VGFPIPFRIRCAYCILIASIQAWSATVLDIDGNAHLSRKKIEAVLSLPEKPKGFSEEDWEAWSDEVTSSLSDMYAEQGYLDVAFRVAPVPDTNAPAGADFHIRLEIREGERYKFGYVKLNVLDQSPAVINAQSLRCRPGRPYDKELVFRDRRDILNAYGDAGFLHCKSTEKLVPDTASKVVNLEFLVEPGPAVVFDTLIIRNGREEDSTGTRGVTSQKLLRSLLGIRHGDTISLAAIGTFEKKLKSTRAFNYVRLRDSLVADKGNGSALILSTEERVPGELDASLFYETQYGAGVSADWSHGNIWGQLHEGRLGGSFAQRKQTVYLGYSSPLFFGTSFRFDNDLISNWYQDSRLQTGVGPYGGDFDITNSSKLSHSFTTWLRYVETTELTGKSEKIDSVKRDRAFNINFINSAFFSFIDDVVNPTRGTRFSFTWGNGGSYLDDGKISAPIISRRHNWLEGESGFYYPLTERLKLAFRFDGGRFFGDGGINSERFFLGGPRSVRSFGWRKVCPEKDSVSETCVKEGLEPAYFLTSLEFRTSPFTSAYINPEGHWRFLLDMQVVPFVDYGNVWEVGKKLTPEGQGRAYGLGLRYSLLSIFNVRLDYAVDGIKRNHDQWVIDLAQAF